MLKFAYAIINNVVKKDLTKQILCDIAFGKKFKQDFYKNNKNIQAFSSLRRYKFIRHTKKAQEHSYALTPKGEDRLRKIVLDDIEIKKFASWNGKWYLVIYDFPIRFKKARNAFRWKLKDLGFLQFQKSVWIYPYPCERELLFVANFYGVGKHIEILEVSKMLDNKKLKTHFGL